MNDKIKKILEEDIKPFNLVSKNNNNYIIKIYFKDKLSTLNAQLTIDFDFIFEKMKIIFVENGQEIHQETIFKELKKYLLILFKTSEITKTNLFQFIWSIIYEICLLFNNETNNINSRGIKTVFDYLEIIENPNI